MKQLAECSHPQKLSVVIGIIRQDKKILLSQRPVGKVLSGYWEFPGGKIEAGESSLSALKRELREELDIEVIHANFCFEYLNVYPDKTVQLDVWLIETFKGEPKSQENQTLQWVMRASLKQLPLLKGNEIIIEQLGLFEVSST